MQISFHVNDLLQVQILKFKIFSHENMHKSVNDYT